jgi:flagellar biosynthesis regulator FlbT
MFVAVVNLRSSSWHICKNAIVLIRNAFVVKRVSARRIFVAIVTGTIRAQYEKEKRNENQNVHKKGTDTHT